MTPSSWITPKAAKGIDSAIAGRGLVATEAIEKDEVVAVKGGHIVSTARLRSLSDRLRNSEIQITDDLHLAALTDDEYEPVMLFINHSCDPNVGFAGNIVLVAMRDIRPGEELTTDYALFDDYDGSMPCQCGTAGLPRRDQRPRLAAPGPPAQVPRLLLLVPPAPHPGPVSGPPSALRNVVDGPSTALYGGGWPIDRLAGGV